MSPANGHAYGSESCHDFGAAQLVTASVASAQSAAAQLAPERIKDLVAELEIPFDPMVIEWRVTNTTKNGKPRGQVIPYADQRAYTDRLNELFTPAGWTRKYAVQTSPTFERSKDQKTVVKVFVTCDLTIVGLGTHSATGEEWADDQNACTSAEAQAFKRACCCFGLGRYLYYFTGAWVDLDDRKRPKSVPQLAGWATPSGWLEGLRPRCASDPKSSERTAAENGGNGQGQSNDDGTGAQERSLSSPDRGNGRNSGQAHVSRTIEDRGEDGEPQRIFRIRRFNRQCWYTCRQPTEDYAEPRLPGRKPV